MHEQTLGQQAAQVMGFVCNLVLQNVADMYQTDDVVDRILIDRDTGNFAFLCHCQDILPFFLNVDGNHIDTRHKDLLHLDLVKVQRGLYKVALVFLEHALLLDGLHNIF